MKEYMTDRIENDMMRITNELENKLKKAIYAKVPKEIQDKNQETYLRYYYAHMILIIYSLDQLKFWTRMSTKPKNALSMLKNDIKKKLKFITNA